MLYKSQWTNKDKEYTPKHMKHYYVTTNTIGEYDVLPWDTFESPRSREISKFQHCLSNLLFNPSHVYTLHLGLKDKFISHTPYMAKSQEVKNYLSLWWWPLKSNLREHPLKRGLWNPNHGIYIYIYSNILWHQTSDKVTYVMIW